MARFIVLEHAGPRSRQRAVEELAADGFVVTDGWGGAHEKALCVGAVTGDEDAAAAVLAALAGAALVVEAVASREVTDRLCDDLRRIGEVVHRVGPFGDVTLAADEEALLALLLGGATLGDAARELHVSRRTADRRLAAARAALGARTTVEALRAAARLGIRPATR